MLPKSHTNILKISDSPKNSQSCRW